MYGAAKTHSQEPSGKHEPPLRVECMETWLYVRFVDSLWILSLCKGIKLDNVSNELCRLLLQNAMSNFRINKFKMTIATTWENQHMKTELL